MDTGRGCRSIVQGAGADAPVSQCATPRRRLCQRPISLVFSIQYSAFGVQCEEIRVKGFAMLKKLGSRNLQS